MASLIMAVLLWLGLKWTDNLDNERGDRWIVLISFIVGLTFGIQFMGFLAIPSIGLLYYFKKYKTTTVKNFLIANIAVVAILMLVYKFSLTYVLQLFGWGEVFFVNNIGLPFNSGSIIIGILFIAAFYFGLSYTRKNNFKAANTIVLCEQKDDKPKYEKDEKSGKYIIVNYPENALPSPSEKHVGILPRMWSTQHAENYMKYYGALDIKMKRPSAELRE